MDEQSAQADVAVVPLDPFKVCQAVNMEIAGRYSKVQDLLDQIIDWSAATKLVPEEEVQQLSTTRQTLIDLSNAFNDRGSAVPQASSVIPHG